MYNQLYQQNQYNNPYYPPTPQSNKLFTGQFVSGYEEVKTALVPIDGTPALLIDDNNSIMYLKAVGEGGKVVIQSYRFSPCTEEINISEEINSPSPQPSFDFKEDIEYLKKDNEELKNKINELFNMIKKERRVKTNENE